MRRPKLSAVVALRTVLDELKAQENKAIDQGKYPMYAYRADMHDLLEASVDRLNARYGNDGCDPNAPILRAMHTLVSDNYSDRYETLELVTDGMCYTHNRTKFAYVGAIRVYATKVLRLAGETVPAGDLSELRNKRRWHTRSEAANG